ncbi:MAG: group 1 glycosyl transferase [uncultured bacterium]|nr:MAG: group 1 glycosyl transferase [uncultured bacterium]OGH14311.1 MAG: hypothetical protein A2687_01645 [Candidatus Levybacteria bacterium RIFCSPHIGHO2_01_FULL_38_26]
MNICVFTHTYPRFPGDPVAPFMQDFCKGLAQQGQNVFVLAPYDKLFSLKQNTVRNLKVKLYKYIFSKRFHTLGYSRTLIGDQRFKPSVFFLAPFMLLFSFFSLLFLVRKEKIQVISAHWIIPNGFIAALVSKITNIPLVVTVPGSDVYLGKNNFLFRWMTKIAASQAKVIVSNSLRYLDELSMLGVNSKKFAEIPYGVNVNNFTNIRTQRNSMRNKLNLSPSDRIILTVGRLVEKKGFAYLIKAMSIVGKKEKSAKLVIIGDGTEKKSLTQLAKILKIEDKILFLGKVNHIDLPKYYALADIYASASIKDKYGNLESHTVALFEAIASGLPIVATKLAVSKKYVIDGKNGYRVNDSDAQNIALGIIKIIRAGDNISSMVKASASLAKKYLSYQYCTKEYVKIFNRFPLPKARS